MLRWCRHPNSAIPMASGRPSRQASRLTRSGRTSRLKPHRSDENTIRHFRNRMTETDTLKRVVKALGWQLHKKGYIPMSGQIVDASLVPAPKQRNTDGEREAIKAGQSADEIWPNEPAKAA